jgi:hypothetical protein
LIILQTQQTTAQATKLIIQTLQIIQLQIQQTTAQATKPMVLVKQN